MGHHGNLIRGPCAFRQGPRSVNFLVRAQFMKVDNQSNDMFIPPSELKQNMIFSDIRYKTSIKWKMVHTKSTSTHEKQIGYNEQEN